MVLVVFPGWRAFLWYLLFMFRVLEGKVRLVILCEKLENFHQESGSANFGRESQQCKLSICRGLACYSCLCMHLEHVFCLETSEKDLTAVKMIMVKT